MFNLTHRRHFPVTKGCEQAVTWYVGMWAFGNFELHPIKEPLNEDNACMSWPDMNAYKIGFDADGRNLLTMSSDDIFTISELEVWALNDE